MSRIGNQKLSIPNNVSINLQPGLISIKGPIGENTITYPQNLINVENVDNHIIVKRLNEEKTTKMLHGTTTANIKNGIVGCEKGFIKQLKIVGVGYKTNVSGDKINLSLGYSHPVFFIIPQELKVTTPTPLEIHIIGANKAQVGEFAAKIRAMREPEPYNGKGVMYFDERIIRKVGKTAEGSKK